MQDIKVSYRRITNAEAKKRFANDLPIYLCPCKCHPCSPWNLACLILGKGYFEQQQMFNDINNVTMTDTQLANKAWNSMLNNWNYYNSCHEMGYYPHYYVQE